MGRESSWSAEYGAAQKAGLQDRKGCLCEEMDHTHLTLPAAEDKKIPARSQLKMRPWFGAQRKREEELFTDREDVTVDS